MTHTQPFLPELRNVNTNTKPVTGSIIFPRKNTTLTLAGQLAAMLYRHPEAAEEFPAGTPNPKDDASGFVAFVNSHNRNMWENLLYQFSDVEE